MVLRDVHRRVLEETHLQEQRVASTPRPNRQEGGIFQWEQERDHGPRYVPSFWFGAETDAEQTRYRRAVKDLAAAGLLEPHVEGTRLTHVRLTDAGRAIAAQRGAEA